MEGNGGFGGFVEKCKPYIAMISLQFGYAGMNIITKASLDRGMSHYVLVVYRNAFATAAFAPFALCLERKIRPKLTFPIFMQIFFLSLLGPVIDQNFYYAGLKLTSPSFSCSMSNLLPAMAFGIALLFRMEKMEIKKRRCQLKILGTLFTVAGAMFMALYRGHAINLIWPHTSHDPVISHKDSVNGSILLTFATLSWASFFILQAITLKNYPAQLSLTAMVCGLGTLQSTAVTFVMEHRTSIWTIGFDMNLLAAAYAGIVSSGIAYYVQGKAMQKRGPVFVAAFSPLTTIIVVITGSLIFAEKIHVGGVIGAVLIVLGLHSVLWGKHKDNEDKEAEEIPEAIKECEKHGHTLTMVVINEENDIEMQKNEAENSAAVVVAGNIRQHPMIATEAPRF